MCSADRVEPRLWPKSNPNPDLEPGLMPELISLCLNKVCTRDSNKMSTKPYFFSEALFIYNDSLFM